MITVSDACSRGSREDVSGPAVARTLDASDFQTVYRVTVPDEQREIEDAIRRAAGMARLVVTTGGTGISVRDVTPEATRTVCERLLEGVAELVRAEGRRTTPLASLSRGVCGTLGATVILNVPGSPKGAVSSLEAALPVLPHALDLLEGKTEHPVGIQGSTRRPAERGNERKNERSNKGKVERA